MPTLKAHSAVAVLWLLTTAPCHSSVLSLDPVDAAPIRAGDTFSIDLILTEAFAGLNAGDELLAFGFETAFESSAAKLTGVTYASSFGDDAALLGLDLAGSAFPGIPNIPDNQSVTLATLEFYAIHAGAFGLSLSGDPSEPDQGLFFGLHGPYAANAALSVDIQPSAVPVPAAFWLFASGLAGLSGRRVCRTDRGKDAVG